jgi:lysozyme
MKLNKKGIDLMHEFEGLSLTAYLCPANVPTIGYGNTYYESGRKVKMGDVITKERADILFAYIAESFAVQVRQLVKVPLNENQFSALVCFAYNLGIDNLKSSTLLKKVNAKPTDTNIQEEFLKWNKAGGKVLNGLTRRREHEAHLYYTPI